MNTVILAVDGSKPSEKAVATAADLLRHYPEARLIVVYAVNPPAFAGGGPVPPSVFEILDQEAQKLWERTQKALDGLNAHEPPYNQLKRFHVMDHDFTQESGDLTPTLKVKRKACTQRYQAILDRLYDGEKIAD